MQSFIKLPTRVSSILCGCILSICVSGVIQPAVALEHRTALEPRAVQDTSYTKVDVMPSPKDGMQAFYQFIGQNFKLSKEAIQAGKSGKVLVGFVVEKDGKISNVELLQDLGNGTGKEGVRVIKKSPKWNPGLMAGQPVRTAFTIPIQITVPAQPKKEVD